MHPRPGTRVVGSVDFRSDRHALITPHYNHTEGRWTEAAPEDYPTRGKILWWAPTLPVTEGSAVIFDLAESHRDRDVHSVEHPQYLHPLLDYEGFSYDEAVERLTSTDHPASDEIIAGLDVFAWCKDGILLGPLTPHIEGTVFRILPNSLRLERVPYRETAVESAIFLLPNSRWYCAPTSPITGYLDCRPDAEVLKTALRDAVALARSSSAEVPDFLSTKNLINKAADLLQEGERLEDRQYKLDRITRALKICSDSDEVRTLAAEVAVLLREDPHVELELKRDRARVRDEVFEEALADVQKHIETEKAELTSLRGEAAALKEEWAATLQLLDETRDELEKADKELARQLDTVEETVRSRISALVDDASDVVGDSVLLRALSSATRSSTNEHEQLYRLIDPFSGRPSIRVESGIDVGEILRRSATSYGIPFKTLVRIHAAVRAGLMPVVTGRGGPTALTAYASAACSGRVVELSIAHDFLHPVDLLGVLGTTPARTRPHGGLLIGADRSVRSEGPSMVVLSGFNQAPTESYLLPWLQSPDYGIDVPEIAHDTVGVSRFVPQLDLVIAATTAAGPTTAPVSPDLWGYAVAIDVPRCGRAPSGSIQRSALDLEPLRDPAQDSDKSVAAFEEALGDNWVIDDGLLESARGFARELTDLQDQDEVFTSVLECLILPALATSLSGRSLDESVDIAVDAAPTKVQEHRQKFHIVTHRLHQRFA
jgi:hypothetical protein